MHQKVDKEPSQNQMYQAIEIAIASHVFNRRLDLAEACQSVLNLLDEGDYVLAVARAYDGLDADLVNKLAHAYGVKPLL